MDKLISFGSVGSTSTSPRGHHRAVRSVGLLLVAAATLLAVPSAAHAEPGLVLKKSALSIADRKGLEKAVTAERKAHPESFAQVAAVRAEVVRLDARKRGRLAPVGRHLQALGPSALWPMLELLALDAGADASPDSAKKAFKIGALEALAALRDPRAEAVLVAAAQNADLELEVGAAAARALGALATPTALDTLAKLAQGDGPARRKAAAGLGESQRSAAVPVLAGLLSDASPEVRGDAVRGLGRVGNAQGWKAAEATRRSDEAATRQAAAEALVPAFATGDDRTRHLAQVAILVVDYAGTPALIEKARAGASPAAQAELDKLAAKFAANPTRLSGRLASARRLGFGGAIATDPSCVFFRAALG